MVIGRRKLKVKNTSDKYGTKGVFIPSEDWKTFKKELETMKKSLTSKSTKKAKPSVLNNLKEALNEVSLMRDGKIRPRNVKDFLREL